MKSSRFWCVGLFVIVIIFGFWIRYDCCDEVKPTEAECCDKHFTDVYFKTDGKQYSHPYGVVAVEELFVFRGDYVVWNNPTDTKANLEFEDSSWFGVSVATVEANGRLIMEVSESATGGGDYSITIGTDSGSPSIKVGDDP